MTIGLRGKCGDKMKAEKLLVEAQLRCKLPEAGLLAFPLERWRRATVLLTDEKTMILAGGLCYSFDHSHVAEAKLLRPVKGGDVRLLQVLYIYGRRSYTLSLKGPRSLLALLRSYLKKLSGFKSLDPLDAKLMSLFRHGLTDVRSLSYILGLDEKEVRCRLNEVRRLASFNPRNQSGGFYYER